MNNKFEDTILFKVNKLSTIAERIADEKLKQQINLTVSQFKICVFMQFEEKKVTQSDLARFIGVTEAAISRQVNVLKKFGYVKKSTNTDNRREHLIVLTQKGKETVQKGVETLNELFNSIFGVLSNEESLQMKNSLDKLLKSSLDLCRKD